jgi:hypothetical protein
MKDSVLRPNYTRPSLVVEGAGKPLAPLWIFKLANLVLAMLLHLRLHRLLSGVLTPIAYRGRKSGKAYTPPIGYFGWGRGKLMAITSERWWVNVLDGKPMGLLLRGQQVEATPTVTHECEAVINTLEEFVKRRGAKTAQAARGCTVRQSCFDVPITNDFRAGCSSLF